MVRATLLATLAFALTAFAQITPNKAGASNVGKGDGSQFITGGCVNNQDCSSACCANASGVGVCSAEAAQFQNGKNGCGFDDPNAAATIAAAKAQAEKQGF
ncbi:biotrophy-associated secreted protein 2 [Colletotrichum truncatum]|uniref:Biotrophy-associated secreted protein 2 n=1 Tax=Colletotrichum truncatum TaxID=5467 RepID=A0ACC3Z8A3_COLTU|nr:biotrophy-associated secreted protein 2 [Colletotrichum truncatum]XP_036580931.1 biotrophy-associated secreted protein 2 [Colletotrichum truncatum]KAF6783614.1 biotrophy-associated secreted protein 2 [Colletotrichum truncatum]KAF6789104.1 biotrophy-associated secreted protein 2 [Colletotrichum truncatum]